MSRPLTVGEELLASTKIERWWEDGAYLDGRPSVDQAMASVAFSVALVVAGNEGSPYDRLGEVTEVLKALGQVVDRVANDGTDPVSSANLVLCMGDLLQRLSGVPASEITPRGEVL